MRNALKGNVVVNMIAKRLKSETEKPLSKA